MDPLEAAFLFCFVFGLAMSGLSFLLGSFHAIGDGHTGPAGAGGSGHVDAHLEAGGHDGALAGSTPDGPATLAHGPSPINVNTVTAFLAFFGGAGYVLYGAFGIGAALALVLAVLAGLIGGSIVFFFLVRVLLAGQRFLDPSDFRLEGSVARVSQSIRADGIGEIVYSRDGTRRSEGARSATGEAIPSGTEVVIVRYERGLAYVEPWKSYVGEA
jgi:hypothetical protein